MSAPLRQRRRSVGNLRAFGPEPQVLDLAGPDGRAPGLAVRRGPNASGSSTALHAIGLRLRAWTAAEARAELAPLAPPAL